MKRILCFLLCLGILLLMACRPKKRDGETAHPGASTTVADHETNRYILEVLDWQKPEIEPEISIETEETAVPDVQREAVRQAEHYLARMLADGWTLKTEHRRTSGADFTLERDSLKRLSVRIGSEIRGTADGKKGFVVIRQELEYLIPKRDAIGFEPPDVPRYPGSTRIRWMNIIGEWSGKYKVADELETVRRFYLDELPKHGWIYQGVQAGKLHFQRGGIASGDAVTRQDIDITDPLGNIAGMIPSTLNIILSEENGITDIGFGRSAGAGDAPTDTAAAEGFSYDAEFVVDRAKVVARVDPETALPRYPGAVNEADHTEWFTLKGPEVLNLGYDVPRGQVQAEKIDLGAFYRRQMKARGWTLTDEDRWGEGTTLFFRRGGVTASVVVRDTGLRFIGNPNVRPSAPATLPVKIALRFPIPQRDLAGEDIDDVPRFPGSKRYYFLKVAIDHLVKYKAAGTADQVYAWFIAELPQRGWQLAGADQAGITFTPAGGPESGVEAFGTGKWIPTLLVVKAKDEGYGLVDIGIDLTTGDN